MDGFALAGGCLVLASVTVAVVDASRRVAARHWPDDRLAALTASVVYAISTVVVLLELFGTLGLLRPAAMALATAAVWGAVFRWDRARPQGAPGGWQMSLPDVRRWLGEASITHLLALAAATGLGLVVVSGCLFAIVEPRPQFDAVSFHLPVAVQWFQEGNTRFLPYESPVSLSAHYPANSQLLALWLMIPTGRDFLVQLASVPGVALTVSATVMLARRLGARRTTALVAGLVTLALPRALYELVGTNMQDALFVGALMAVAAFAALHMKEYRRANLVVAGLAAGLALGARYAALVSLPPLLLLYLLPIIREGRRRRTMLWSTLLIVAGGVVATGSYFYARNQMITGSPVYPQSVPWRHIEATEQINFHLISSYAGLGLDLSAWRNALKFILDLDGIVALLLAVGVAVPPLIAIWTRTQEAHRWVWAFVPLAAALTFALTPGSAGYEVGGELAPSIQAQSLRYGVYVLPLSAAVLAAELVRFRQWVDHLTVALVGLLTVAVTLRLNWSALPLRTLIVLASGVALAAVAFWAVRSIDFRLALAGTAIAGLVGALASPAMARRYDARRLSAGMPYEAHRLAMSEKDRTVAIAGFCRMYGLYGPTFDRRVEYLTGADDGIDRPLASSFGRWVESLRAHDIDAVVVGADACLASLDLPYESWARSHPDLFEVLYGDEEGTLYRFHSAAR